MSVGFTEMILIVLFITVVFGAKRIPELARALGRAEYEFNKAKTEFRDEKETLLQGSPAEARDHTEK